MYVDKIGRRCTFLLLLIMLSSCANYKLNVSKNISDPIPALPDTLALTHTLYLVGNAGNAKDLKNEQTLRLVKKRLAKAPKSSSVVFLGDNVPVQGFPAPRSPQRADVERALDAQLNSLKGFKGKAFMVPGYNDWQQGRVGVERIEKYVQDYPGIDIRWEPDNGCSGPDDEDDLTEDLVIVFIDSQWWMMDWKSEPALNLGCEITSKETFLYFFEETLKKNRHKNVVIVMHHPLYSNGHRGGKYTLREHFFPLKDLPYLPLPGVGSLISFLRAKVGTRQDLSHPEARVLQKKLTDIADKYGHFIFAAGHENNLQYIEREGQSFIISGAASGETSPAHAGEGVQFAYGGVQGFSLLRFYEDGSVWVDFKVVADTHSEGRLVFRKKIKGALPALEEKAPPTFPEYEAGLDTIVKELDPTTADSEVHRFFFGDHYRDAYTQKMAFPVFDLATYKGGLTPVKRGGGSQTNSLRLEATNGQEYTMRSILKDPRRLVPSSFNRTFVKDIIADQFYASHPFGAFVVPPMAKAAGVYHTNPAFYYVPAQPRLANFNPSYAGNVYLVEERPDGNWEEQESFGHSKEIIGTLSLVEEMMEDKNHRVDQDFTLRTRLFDILIGDWDRHDDQFRWAQFEQADDKKIYRPIPRDRDQVFAKYDGLVLSTLKLLAPAMKKLMNFKARLPRVKWLVDNSKYFDASFLNEVEEADFLREAQWLQAQLTDSIIEKAIQSLPPAIYKQEGKEIIEKLISRRNNLVATAQDFYQHLAKKVVVIGTYGNDYFEIERLNDEQTRVRLYESNDEGERKELLYERTFLTQDTKEIRLYGLDAEDYFHLSGAVQKGIVIRCIGGEEEDFFLDHSKVSGITKKTKIYDSTDGNHVEKSRETSLRLTDNPIYNSYNRRAIDYKIDYQIFTLGMAFNPDDGLLLGLGSKSTNYGFKKTPFASQHEFGFNYALGTLGWELEYVGTFTRAIGSWDFLLEGRFSTPRHTRNYFGLGNETVNLLEESLDYNRIRQKLYGVYPSIRKQIDRAGNSYFSLKGTLEAVQIEETEGRFLSRENIERVEVFETLPFAGLALNFKYENVDNIYLPTNGIQFNALVGWKSNLKDSNRNFAALASDFAFYVGNENVSLASRVGASHLIGQGFEFYQAGVLGGSNNLRGFRDERFSGRTVFYHNSDFRVRLFETSAFYFPIRVGVFAGFDYGRVWLEAESSNQWHQSYGGGIWLSPFDAATFNISWFAGGEQSRFQFGGGFLF